MNLNAKLVKKENALATVEVTVDREEVKKEFENTARGYQEKSVLPGFRKGKAPLSIIKNKFRQDIVDDALNTLVNRSYLEAVDKAGIRPYTLPEITVKKFQEEEDLHFVAEVQLAPEVTLDKYRDLCFTRDEYTLEEPDIEAELKKLQERSADLVQTAEKPAGENDVAFLDIRAFDKDGKPVKELSSENYRMEIKKEEMDRDFHQALLGARAGEEKELTKAYPDNFSNRTLAGKSIRYRITVKEVREKKLPLLDDEFAKDMGYENLRDLRSAVERQIKDIIEKKVNENLENQIVKKAVENAAFSIPEKLITDRTALLMKEFQQNLHSQGHDIRALVDQKVIDMEGLQNELRQKAADEIRSSLLLMTIADKEKMKVEEAELEDFCKDEAVRYKVNPEDYKKRLGKEGTDYIRRFLLNRKVLEFLRKNNRVKKGRSLKFTDLLKERERQ